MKETQWAVSTLAVNDCGLGARVFVLLGETRAAVRAALLTSCRTIPRFP